MVDPKKVSEEDSTSQFLAPRDEVGKNRAEASLARVQQLNPMVEVTADSASSEEKDADFFKKFAGRHCHDLLPGRAGQDQLDLPCGQHPLLCWRRVWLLRVLLHGPRQPQLCRGSHHSGPIWS